MNRKSFLYKTSEIETWIIDLGLRELLNSDPVQRLKEVRFLGTMEYFIELSKKSNRYEHSLRVAHYVDVIGEILGISTTTRRLMIVMAILHDIGHMPFSHASEVFFRKTWGKYHTGHSSRLMQHLVRYLKAVDAEPLADLVNQAKAALNARFSFHDRFEERVVNEVFHGVLSADKLDGITRAAESIGIESPSVIDIISGLSRSGNEILISGQAQLLVEQFLDLERNIYLNYVHSTMGLSAEAMLTRSLEITFPSDSDKKEFLSLDDRQACEKCMGKSLSRDLMQRLEAKDLFASLREVAPEKHSFLSSILTKTQSGVRRDLILKNLEKKLADQIGISDPSYCIFHSTIRHKFTKAQGKQERLFDMPNTLIGFTREYRSTKSYENIFEVFFPPENIKSISALSIPKALPMNNNIQERKNENNSNYAYERHRGAYMTPFIVAEFLASWSIRRKDDRVIDPACGEGVFLEAAYKKLVNLGKSEWDAMNQVHGCESDVNYWTESRKRCSTLLRAPQENLVNQDFFDYVEDFPKSEGVKFDSIIGNPPYVRASRFDIAERKQALKLAYELTGVRLSQRVSSWAPYVICSTALLKRTGRLGMVLPVELLSTDYAEPVRHFLMDRFRSLLFIFFEKFVFPSVQQEVVLLLASNDGPRCIKRIELRDQNSLGTEVLESAQKIGNNAIWYGHKWTHFFADQDVFHFINDLVNSDRVARFEDKMTVSIGHVTGNNKFFLLSNESKENFGIGDNWISPTISRASDIRGAVLREEDLQRLINRGQNIFMLRIPPSANIAKDGNLAKYLESGKLIGVDQGYKCRSRWPWYSVPLLPAPDAFLTYMSGNIVRFVLNMPKAQSTNTIHNVSFKSPVNKEIMNAYTVGFYSSITGLSTELVGRVYGGGVLKLEIGDTRNILLPNFEKFPSTIVRNLGRMLVHVDESIRSGNMEIFKEIDQLILNQGLGLEPEMCESIRREKDRLRRRRMFRYH